MAFEKDEIVPVGVEDAGRKFQPPAITPDGFYTPTQLANRWHWHPESVRRAAREGRFETVIVGRRRLIPVSAVNRIEKEGFVSRM